MLVICLIPKLIPYGGLPSIHPSITHTHTHPHTHTHTHTHTHPHTHSLTHIFLSLYLHLYFAIPILIDWGSEGIHLLVCVDKQHHHKRFKNVILTSSLLFPHDFLMMQVKNDENLNYSLKSYYFFLIWVEMLKVVSRVLIALRGAQNTNWHIVINHFDVLDKILELCGINQDLFEKVSEILESHGRKVRFSFCSSLFVWMYGCVTSDFYEIFVLYFVMYDIFSNGNLLPHTSNLHVSQKSRWNYWVHIWNFKLQIFFIFSFFFFYFSFSYFLFFFFPFLFWFYLHKFDWNFYFLSSFYFSCSYLGTSQCHSSKLFDDQFKYEMCHVTIHWRSIAWKKWTDQESCTISVMFIGHVDCNGNSFWKVNGNGFVFDVYFLFFFFE